MRYGPARFYYGQTVPPGAVEVAKITARPHSSSDVIDINTTPYGAAPLTVTSYPSGTVVDAVAPGNVIRVSGSTSYLLENQFFSVTNKVDPDGKPYFYQHRLPAASVSGVKITDLNGTEVTTGYLIDNGFVFHDFDGSVYRISYYYAQVQYTKLLQYTPVLTRGQSVSVSTYTVSPGGYLVLPTTGSYWFRFSRMNGYTVLPPYNAPPNDPWYPRIRFFLRPVDRGWAQQQFFPVRPYQLASWVPGKVLSTNLIEFERKQVWWDPLLGQYPDVLVYDKDYQIKYALDGVPSNLSAPADKGYLFPWHSSQITDMDPTNARVQTIVDLATDDIVFGFYPYSEPDLVYRELDVNPFSNPEVKEKVISFYYKDQPSVDLRRAVYFEIQNISGTLVRTNDPSPSTGTKHYFGTLVVGFSVGVDSITVMDTRTRGGGLLPEYQTIEEAQHMWDTGYWDGKPYPLGGTCVIQLPLSILSKFTRDQVKAKIEKVLPIGALQVIRYYDSNGEETV